MTVTAGRPTEAASVKDTFEHAKRGLRELCASPWEWEVVEVLERHGAREGELLERYRRFADTAESPAVRYLVRLILDEERRHHETFAGLADAIAWGSARTTDGDEQIPVLPLGRGDPELKAETAKLLASERADSSELRSLLRRMRSVRNTTVWALLIELMLDDTDKHIRILRFLEKNGCHPRVASPPPAGD